MYRAIKLSFASLFLWFACKTSPGVPNNNNQENPFCGDGVIDEGEACDDGNFVNGDECESDCTIPRCGNRIGDPGEECDDGNNTNGDGCDALCVSEPPPPPPCLGAPFPIVLVHGMGGFDSLGTLAYYFQVEDALLNNGEQVFTAEVSQFQSSEVRGSELATFVDEALATSRACKVNIIAHSQGGLDVRYLLGTLGYGDRVAAVVTIGTPHQGTPVADAVLGLTPGVFDELINAFLGFFGLVISNPSDDPNVRASLESLSEARVASFAQENPDDVRVAFFSVAGRTLGLSADNECAGGLRPNPSTVDLIEPVLLPLGLFLQGIDLFNPIPNDGLVPLSSQKHGVFLGCIPADHADEIGQLADLFVDPVSNFDHKAFYRELASFLHQQGF